MINIQYSKRSEHRLREKRGSFPLLIAIVVAVVFLSGCSKGYSRFMRLPSDPSVGSGLGWAAVTSAYTHVKKLPVATSDDISVVRRGTVFLCTERKIDPEGQDIGGLWYRYIDGGVAGWIHSSDLSIFSSEEQARVAVGSLQ
ncbi:MAG TPA: hypothetical protein VN445_02525 [Rectinemataceae bacterium]|nr:hypothetical protein [Rectinemataceae bacterium]